MLKNVPDCNPDLNVSYTEKLIGISNLDIEPWRNVLDTGLLRRFIRLA